MPDNSATGEASVEHQVSSDLINIKQEITGTSLEITDLEASGNVAAEEAPVDPEAGIPVSIDEFVNFHNDQVKQLKDQLEYMGKCFEIMYKYKNVCELIYEDYFAQDPHFKYKNALDDLEADLVAFISEDEAKYTELCDPINTDFVLTEDDQIEFAESTLDDDFENEMDSTSEGGNLVQIVNGEVVNTPTIRKLPGQKPAELPECPACGHKARCRLKLEAHILEHGENPLVVCNHEGCNMPFELHGMFQHEKSYHPEVNLICEMCNEGFESKSMLIQHYKLHIKKKDKLKCHLCDYTDIYLGRMDRHKQTVHGLTITKQFKCDFEGCGRVFKDRPSFYTHSLIHKDRSLVYKHKCTVDGCDSVFKRRRNLSIHMMKHGMNRRRYTCAYSNCKRTYTRERELARHIEISHRDPEQGGSLQTIKREFEGETVELESAPSTSNFVSTSSAGGSGITSNENIIYLKSVNDSNVATVISCEDMEVDPNSDQIIEVDENGKSTNNKIIMLLNNNMDQDQKLELVTSMKFDDEILCEGDTTITDECELCLTKFPSSQEMISHLKERHHQYTIRAYRCDFEDCNFATHFRSILGKHKNQVHGGKYKCEVCGKLSKDSGNHNRHRNIHKNVVFRCRHENCDAVYKSPKAYYVHVLTHSNEQPVYRCDFPNCKYVTYYMNTLNVHKLTHSDVRSFFCPYENCGKGFKRNGDLNKHVTHSHKGVKRPQKKRKIETTVMYRCTWPSCHYTCMDSDVLNKHEEEHAANSVERFKYEAEEVEA